ncbi:MAG: disulfide bond formation protein DsbA [Symbiobacteriaceae bacterium]|nr:disulfide bond formation protein DsbA [Symbiobacteriaceae bacterium]
MIWRPFELRPEGAPPKDRAYIENAFTNWVAPMARDLGVEMRMPTHEPQTRLAHEAAAFARSIGKEAELADAIFKAHWVHGRDIGRVEVLCDIALSAGIDPVEMRGVLEEGAYRQQVAAELRLAQQYRIQGVPFFIFDGKYAASGLQREEQLRRAIATCRGEGLIQLDE